MGADGQPHPLDLLPSGMQRATQRREPGSGEGGEEEDEDEEEEGDVREVSCRVA